MQLIVILLVTVSVLTLLSGITVFFGSSKKYRVRAFWFLLAAIFATVWMVTISQFLVAEPGSEEALSWPIRFTFISAILLDIAFLAYTAWMQKFGKIMTLVFLIFGLIVSALIAIKPELLYSEVVLSKTGNAVTMNIGPLYIAYNAFFGTIVPAVIYALIRHYLEKKKSTNKPVGDIIIMASFGVSSVITLIFNLILPLFGNWNLIWLGPLALSATIIGFYYTILRYSTLNLSSMWLRLFSYIVIVCSLAIIYMMIFALLFASMFRGATPSTEVIVLNFIMIVIIIILMPAVNELSNFIRSLISNSQKKE